MTDKKPSGFESEFTEPGFWAKATGFAKLAGRDVIHKALQLFYAGQSPDTPAWAKSVILGALGYFITTIDAVPDITPIVGFTDDLGVIVAALATVASCITPEVKARAQEKVDEWFKDEKS